jgi:cell division protein FtsB
MIWWITGSLFIGLIIGFFTCALLAMGGRADLESENRRLKEKNNSLRAENKNLIQQINMPDYVNR